VSVPREVFIRLLSEVTLEIQLSWEWLGNNKELILYLFIQGLKDSFMRLQPE
jgi:hypothetical protein